MAIYEVSWGSKKKAYKTALGAYKKFKDLRIREPFISICKYSDNDIEEILSFNNYLLEKFTYTVKNGVEGSDRILEEYYFSAIYEEFNDIQRLTTNLIYNLTNIGVIVNSREIKRSIIKYFLKGYSSYNRVNVLVNDSIHINIDDVYKDTFEYKNKKINRDHEFMFDVYDRVQVIR